MHLQHSMGAGASDGPGQASDVSRRPDGTTGPDAADAPTVDVPVASGLTERVAAVEPTPALPRGPALASDHGRAAALRNDLERLEASVAQPADGSPAARRRARRQQTADPAVSRVKFAREVAAYQRHETAYRQRGWMLQDATFPVVFMVLCVPQARPACVLFGVEIDFTNYDAEPPSVRLVDPFTRAVLTAQALITLLPRRVRRAQANARGSDPCDGSDLLPSDRAADSGHSPLAGGAVDTPGRALRRAEPPVTDGARRVAEHPGGQRRAHPPGQSGDVTERLSHPEEIVNLLQVYGATDVPFLCVPGVWEYHAHPAHSGDPWLLHRGRGEGTLDAILNVLHTYAAAPVVGYRIGMQLAALPTGEMQVTAAVIQGLALREIPT